jgi:hypothetical protein
MRLALRIAQRKDAAASGQHVVAVATDAMSHGVAFILELVGKGLPAGVIYFACC